MSSGDLALAPVLRASTWHEALSRPDGRDRLFRLLQYACKLVRGVGAGAGAPAAGTGLGRVASLEGALGSARQLWRLFKWVSVYARAAPSAGARLRTPRMPDVAAVAADAALFAYLLADNVAFVRRSGVLPGDAPAATRRAARFWLAAALASAAGAAAHWVEVRAQMNALARAVAERKSSAESGAVAQAREEFVVEARRELELVVRRQRVAAAVTGKHVADAVVATSLSREKPFHPAVVGAFGAFSSLVGLWQVWPRYVPTG